MSMGWNPTFTDVKSNTIEPRILHDFTHDPDPTSPYQTTPGPPNPLRAYQILPDPDQPPPAPARPWKTLPDPTIPYQACQNLREPTNAYQTPPDLTRPHQTLPDQTLQTLPDPTSLYTRNFKSSWPQTGRHSHTNYIPGGSEITETHGW
jgi:hypothetical protein